MVTKGDDARPGLSGCFPPPPTSSCQGFLTHHQRNNPCRPCYQGPKVTNQMRTPPHAPRPPWSRAHFQLPTGRLLPLPLRRCAPFPQPGGEGLLPEYLSLCFSFAGDAPFCTPEQHKECAEPALGQYWGRAE